MNEEQLKQWLETDEGKAWEQNHTAGLRTTLGAIKGEKSEIKAEAESAKARAAELEAKLAELTGKQTELSPDIEAKLTAAQQKEQEALRTAQTYQKKLTNQMLATQITGAIMDAEGNPELLSLHVRTRLATETKSDGEIVIYALTKDGKKMYDADGNPAGVKEIVAELKKSDSFKSAFKATVAPGTNGVATHSTGKKISFMDATRDQLNDLTLLEQNLFQ